MVRCHCAAHITTDQFGTLRWQRATEVRVETDKPFQPIERHPPSLGHLAQRIIREESSFLLQSQQFANEFHVDSASGCRVSKKSITTPTTDARRPRAPTVRKGAQQRLLTRSIETPTVNLKTDNRKLINSSSHHPFNSKKNGSPQTNRTSPMIRLRGHNH